VIASTASARDLAVWIGAGAIVAATSVPSTPSYSTPEKPIVWRTFAGATPKHVENVIRQTTPSEIAPPVIGAPRAEDAVLAQLKGLTELQSGWDGESAEKPSAEAIESAMRFIILGGTSAADLDSSPHVDGSIILESEAGLSLRFLQGGKIAYARLAHGCGEATFDGVRIPKQVLEFLA
jgi:hypothetical protein